MMIFQYISVLIKQSSFMTAVASDIHEQIMNENLFLIPVHTYQKVVSCTNRLLRHHRIMALIRKTLRAAPQV